MMKSNRLSHSIPRSVFFVIILLFTISVSAQFPESKREKRLTNKADELYNEKNFTKAIEKYKEIISRYEGNPDVWYKIAESFRRIDQPDKATIYYKRIIKTDEQSNPIVHLSLGQVYMMQGKYEDARTHFRRYNELLEYNDQLAMRYISSIENIERYFADSSFFVNENLPVNSTSSDFSASIIDNSFYFLSTRNKKDDINEKYSSDLFSSNINEEMIFDNPKKISGGANTKFGEIGYAIDEKTKEIYICRYEPGQQNEYSLGYHLYKAFIGVNKEISKPEKFDNEKFRYAIAYPTLSQNGKFIVFASDAPGGFGGWDLYKADFTEKGFDNIKNLGEKINSAGDELYPYLLNDTIIFFSTDGHGGLGGFDIYSKNMQFDNEYARNLGYPINSSSNDYGIYFINGLSGYFTSNRDGGIGKDDIYKFSIKQLKLVGEIVDNENGENLKNVNIKVNRSSNNNEVLVLADNGKLNIVAQPGEELEIIVEKDGYETNTFTVNTANMAYVGNHSLKIGKLQLVQLEPEPVEFELAPTLLEKSETPDFIFGVQIASSKNPLSTKELGRLYRGDENVEQFYDGKEYKYYIGKNKSYFLSKEVYKSYKKGNTFLISLKEEQPYKVMKALKEAHVKPAEEKDSEVHEFIDKTKQISSQIIYYGLDLFRVPEGYDNELILTLDALNANPDFFLEIATHTDKRGSDLYNRALSEERAKFLQEYFVSKGINDKRIIAHGIGEKQLKKYCQDCSEADHEQNRRAELIIRVFKE